MPPHGLKYWIAGLFLLTGAFTLLISASYGQTDNYSLEHHFGHPLPPQGPSPKTWTSLEASLNPQDCRTCHPVQFEGWKGSRHAQATGPGYHGQMLVHLNKAPQASAKDMYLLCSRCHAPLAEQRALTAEGMPNPLFKEDLYQTGVSCPVCHIRNFKRHGPPGRTPPIAKPPHGGYKAHDFFTKSEFCATCHQFKPGQSALNGKLFEDTYAQWQRSRFPSEGKQCQNCHMPDRQHLWRGIHDAAMVKSGVSLKVLPVIKKNSYWINRVTLTSHQVGHLFPTYMTPQVLVTFTPQTSTGKLTAPARVFRVGWYAENLKTEITDARLKPGGRRTFTYTLLPGAATHLKVTVKVDPQEFYRRLFQKAIKEGRPPNVTKAYQKALNELNRAVFTLYDETVILPKSNG